MLHELAASLQHGNGYIIAILLLGFVTLWIFFQRLIMLHFVYNIDFGKFLANLRKMVQAEDLDRAITLCKNVSGTSLPRICQRALESAETDPTKVRGTIEEESLDFLPNIERWLGALPAFAVLILMIGILGTVDSLWESFRSIDVLDTAQKQATLSQGIAKSLNSTALGLLFGMIALAGYYLLRGRAIYLLERINHGVTVLTNLLVPHEVATYLPMQAGAGESGAQSSAGQESTAGSNESQSENVANAEESFDDVSVEDIKDEEEII